MTARRPNFLFFITDQQRADHLGCYGNPVVKTPHIDALAARGVAFDRFYVASAICMPNRSSIMTGRMPSAHGVRHNGIPLSLDAVTFADLLREAGYFTALIGKSHLQNMTETRPGAQARAAPPEFTVPPAGMTEADRRAHQGAYDQESPALWRQGREGRMRLPFYGFSEVDLLTEHGDVAGADYPWWLRDRGMDPARITGHDNALPAPDRVLTEAWRSAVPEELSTTSYVVEHALTRLRDCAAAPDRPFFMYCAFPDPHHPWTPPGKYWDMYRPEDMPLPPSWQQAHDTLPPHVRHLWDARDAGRAVKGTPALYACTEREAREALALTYGSISHIDDGIGRVLAELQALGLDRDTIVVFTTDHGDYMGDHQLLLKGPIHYQPLIRAPFIWAEPGGRMPVRQPSLTGSIDIAPTILERARVAPFNGMQGESLLPAIAGTGPAPRRRSVLIEEEGQRTYLGFTSRVRMRTLVTTTHRLSIYADVEWGELYDLVNDPHEMRNLWDDPAATALKGDLILALARRQIELAETSPSPSRMA